MYLQVLAINRGENLKILSVKVVVPEYAFNKFKQFCEQKWLNAGTKTSTRIRIFQESLKDSYKRLSKKYKYYFLMLMINIICF